MKVRLMAPPTTILSSENLRVYVIHYTPFEERRTHMERVLSETGLADFPVTWILEHDREALLDQHARGEWGNPRALAASSVSLILKHLAAYHAAASQPDAWHLILEDDILVAPDFLHHLQDCLRQLPADWELFFIGLGCNLHVPWWKRRPGRRVYFRGHKPWFRCGGGTSRCTEGYLVRPEFARKLLDSRWAKPPFDCPIDWLLAKAGYEMHIQSYWAEPPLLTQGAFESWTKDPLLNPSSIDNTH